MVTDTGMNIYVCMSHSAASSLRALANKYESEKTSANQQLMDLSLQLAEARKREAQLTSTTDTLREQVRKGREKGCVYNKRESIMNGLHLNREETSH